MTKKLMLGLGGTVDYEIRWDSAVLESLVAQYSVTAAELDARLPITSERDLLVALLAFVRDGVGGERFVASSDIVEQFAARFSTEITLGGTCVRAAIAMEALNIPATVHLVSIDDNVRRLLPESTRYISSAQEDSLDPHLIVQFGEGASVVAGDIAIRSPHPNRVIFTNDPPNRELRLSDELGAELSNTDVFMFSGFNVIQEPGVLTQRLTSIRRHMNHLPDSAIVFYEDAGYHVPELSIRVRDALIDIIDVYSMNEDEMQAYLGRRVELLDAHQLHLDLVQLHALIPARVLVVHTKYWSIALGDRPHNYAHALRGGVVMASTRYVYGDGFTAADYARVEAFPTSTAGTAVALELAATFGASAVTVPGLQLDTLTPTTIGLGDTFVGGFVAALAR
ncbi:ADP-dependent glucokinase/phosphofructokinase [uncultured Salinibacterium sp.]|uniref:ADP-dependent glucokinase/phosphofructokinase n=1 Tax=uncultured Salinibacterium sp. TaxID=459274 RepID=UPI0030DBEBA1|tara:strand:+ start:5109 stop:6293 length:1185 start_codon:yes stop_codon:yes gene_type:complete